jgi:hypothetical protein
VCAVSDIDIDLVSDHIPATREMTKIFDSRQSWAMFREGDDYCMTYHPPDFEKPFWLSRISNSFNKVAVYCGEELIRRRDGRIEVSNPVRYPLDQILLMYYLSRRDGLLAHAAGVEIGSKGYLFAGRSGAGKSTLSALFSVRQNITRLSDDRMVIRKSGDVYTEFGTPWPGEGGIAENRGAPLSGIFFLIHGDSHGIEELTPQKGFEMLLPVVSIPWYDQEISADILSSCEEMIYSVPTYRLFFTPDAGITDLIINHVSG